MSKILYNVTFFIEIESTTVDYELHISMSIRKIRWKDEKDGKICIQHFSVKSVNFVVVEIYVVFATVTERRNLNIHDKG